MTDPNFYDEFDAMSHQSLQLHFGVLDDCLWKAIGLIAQSDPTYIQRCALYPAIRRVMGTENRRKWFTGNQDTGMSVLIDAVRLWVQHKFTWQQWCHHVRPLGLFRDTLYSWVANAPQSGPQAQWYTKHYIEVRNQIALGFVPLARKLADSYGFTIHSCQDLRQIAFTGIVHAIERFHDCGPATFPNFCGRWIRQRILHHVTRKNSLIYVSHSVLDANRKIEQIETRKGTQDKSRYAQQIKQTCAMRHVALLDSCDTFAKTDVHHELLGLEVLPKHLKQLVIAKFGLLEHASPNVGTAAIDAEGARQKNVQSQKPCNGGD